MDKNRKNESEARPDVNYSLLEGELIKEKLFEQTKPKSRVRLDLVNELKEIIDTLPAQLPAQIVNYQKVIQENGEYYLLRQGKKNLTPLPVFLRQNKFSLNNLLLELEKLLPLLKNKELLEKLFPVGLNAANFWLDDQQRFYLLPEAFLKLKQNYGTYTYDLPGDEYFKPPEIISGSDWTQEAYLFNLAADFYYFLSGQTIFADQDSARVLNKIQQENILDLKLINPKLPEALTDLMQILLRRKASARPDLADVQAKLTEILQSFNEKIELDPWLENQDILVGKVVKRKRRQENAKLFLRQKWKFILFLLVVGGTFIWSLTSGPPPTITKANSPAEVVNYFYQAVADKNITLVEEAAQVDLGQMDRLISESHVIEKMQQAYSDPTKTEQTGRGVYSLTDLTITQLSSNGKQALFLAKYKFDFRDKNGIYKNNLTDQLKLTKIDGVWRITKIAGDFGQMIQGKYPWQNKSVSAGGE
ncbi:hypothetical protein [Halanaerobium salsuginis]|jgi:hypothetical protein|uniref:Protein kinase domain-containing protein n=1 Tax=Halanaerobium salsuginis TaxID=29563 RepID=A0A1I4GWM6_9FIRM|nr:hypothetical protein [Halanaerobium salsuginis]SFL33536.1 hypothetical protein SAMN02983006_00876 [Halanaerobium salsuginis]